MMSPNAALCLLISISLSAPQVRGSLWAGRKLQTTAAIQQNAKMIHHNDIETNEIYEISPVNDRSMTFDHRERTPQATNDLGGRNHQEQQSKSTSSSAVSHNPNQDQASECMEMMRALQGQFVAQVIKQRVADQDHLMMEKWLVDNINDLHRELKQTEMDFEHYVEVTKNILARSELEERNAQLKRQLALQTTLPLSIPLQTSDEHVDYRHHHRHLTKLLLANYRHQNDNK